MNSKASRIAFGVFIFAIMASVLVYVYATLINNHQQNWQAYYVVVAQDIFNNGGSINQLPQHSLEGFPLLLCSCSILVVSVLLFVFTRFCIGVSRKKAVVGTIVVFIIMIISIVLFAADYYRRDFKANVDYLYTLNHNNWYEENPDLLDSVVQSNAAGKE